MKVEKPGLVKFCHVRSGQVFEYEGKIYMRVLQITVMDSDGKDEIICNAISLVNGDENVFEDDEEVMVYNNAKVVIE